MKKYPVDVFLNVGRVNVKKLRILPIKPNTSTRRYPQK